MEARTVPTPLPQPRTSAAALLIAVALASAGPSTARSTAYLAPPGYCSGNWVAVMLCLHQYARHQAGLPLLHVPETLMRAADAKSGDIVRCGFSHSACGRPFSYRVDWAGYHWTRFGENIAFATGSPQPSARAVFAAWLRSTDHRANILDPAFRDVGVGSRTGLLGGESARFWVTEFGRR
jgi:uncharacterized protein YkwD